MKFFSENDVDDYRRFLIKSLNEAMDTLTASDPSIAGFLIGEFQDGSHAFVTIHPYSSIHHIRHTEYDHFGSLVMDLLPPGCSMMLAEVKEAMNGKTYSRTERNH